MATNSLSLKSTVFLYRRLIQGKSQAMPLTFRYFSTAQKDSKFLKLVQEKSQQEKKISQKVISFVKLQQDQQPQQQSQTATTPKFAYKSKWQKFKEGPQESSKPAGGLKFIQRVTADSSTSSFASHEADATQEFSTRFTIESFMKQYHTLDKKFESSRTLQDKFDISLKVMQKIFQLKTFESPEHKVKEIEDIISKHMTFMLMEYSMKEQRVQSWRETIKVEATNFELLITLFDSPIKIRIQFFQSTSVASAFIQCCFNYLQELLAYSTDQDSTKRIWVSDPQNKKFITAICLILQYCQLRFPQIIKKYDKFPEKVKVALNEDSTSLLEKTEISATVQSNKVSGVDEKAIADSGTPQIADLAEDFEQVDTLLENEDLLKFDLKILSDLNLFILQEQIKALLQSDEQVQQKKAELESMNDLKKIEQHKLQLENLDKFVQAKLVILIKFMDKVIQTLNVASTAINVHYHLFDECHYLLIRFQSYISAQMFTELAFGLVKKNSQRKNEDVLFIWRQKIHESLGNFTVAHLQKVLYLLSRSQFPFSEIIYYQLFFLGPQQLRNLSKLKPFEIGSIIPSLAKSRFNNNLILNELCKMMLTQYKDDLKFVEPSFLKVVIERIISLDYKETEEAKHFFKGLRDIVAKKSSVIHTTYLSKVNEANGNEETLAKLKRIYDKQTSTLASIDLYCDYVLRKNDQEYKVQLMVDEQ